jgi:hypothetical protein
MKCGDEYWTTTWTCKGKSTWLSYDDFFP